MKQRTSWARRMRAITAAAWASAGLANSASATISFSPNTPDSTLRVTHTANLSIGAAGTSGTYGPAYGYLAFTPAVTVGSGGSAKIILDVSWLDKNGVDLRDSVGTTLFYSSSSTTPYSSSQKLDGGVTFATNDKFIVKG